MDRYRYDDQQQIEEIENYALGLAIEYNLVTPLTSMLVVQKDDQGQPEGRQMAGMRPGMAFDSVAMSPGSNTGSSVPGIFMVMICSILCFGAAKFN